MTHPAKLKTVIDRFCSANFSITGKGLRSALLAVAWNADGWTFDALEAHYDTLVRAVWQKLALGEEAAAQLLRALAQKPAVGDGPYSPSAWEEHDSYQERREAFWEQMEAVAGPPPAALHEAW